MISALFSNPIGFFLYIIALFAALSVHEAAHALAADRLGDPTARLQGRVSLNPLKHLDMYGILFLLFFGFGWGRPVEYDPFNLKEPRKDGALIALAGPLSNLLSALLLSVLLKLFIFVYPSSFFIIGLFTPFIVMSVTLGLFNLIPVYPLDGFSIVGGFLSHARAQEWFELKRYGILFLILLIIPIAGSSLVGSILQPVASFIINLLLPSMRSSGVI